MEGKGFSSSQAEEMKKQWSGGQAILKFTSRRAEEVEMSCILEVVVQGKMKQGCHVALESRREKKKVVVLEEMKQKMPYSLDRDAFVSAVMHQRLSLYNVTSTFPPPSIAPCPQALLSPMPSQHPVHCHVSKGYRLSC